ncbi:radical SAM family heme chaperone HemW [Aeromicrobium wangtongii]|uniref:Heme chaperone HemW n=1 Tax=Aeromicrobium wangtongii TaxID=2969247 RepID=A0ABY5MDK5_9ACTN|nr:radical SAM family heme chaperone HemW [Aeromicrobium wangtongii]MCD9197323.1 radical SAM family heme chaperone HemW [Aeromicrobium wangtongii]UUP14817.1 radical SAM family heme chaperone HemW [Aeromicrobium wangtongii]
MNSTQGPLPTPGGRASVIAGARPFGVYVHVPFCRVRCGYCDFNTYTADELGEGATRASYADTAISEIVRSGAERGRRPVETVFFGGGTPTQLPSSDLVRILDAIDDTFGLVDGVEVTTEANPDSVTPESLATLKAGGFTRISFGVQSAVPHVLATLERTHDPANVPQAVRWAREAGFEQLSVDLIYGTPGESMDDWRASLEQAIALEPDHVSAYALIVEQGTAFARKVRRGEVVMPDDDETADKYVLADEMLTAAGLGWYELSNWARDEAAWCRHNVLYWHSDDWLGIGPGAHSHVAGERWWNVKHPAAYAQRLAAGESPRHDGESIDGATARVERIMLETRLRSGLDLSALTAAALAEVPDVVGRGLADVHDDHLVLTRPGRLLADAVVRQLVD